MEGGTQNPSSNTSKGSLVSLTASSMINASDMLAPEVYQANLKRIQEMKELIQRIEDNNDTAHRNFLTWQLQKRVQEGRQAEEELARLRSTARIPDNMQSGSHPPNNNQPDVILPSTATIVEVPEGSVRRSPPSHGTPAPSNTLPHAPPVQQHPIQQHQPFQSRRGFVSQQPTSSTLYGQSDGTPHYYVAPGFSQRYSQQGQTLPQSHPQATEQSGRHAFRSYPQQTVPSMQRYNPAWNMYAPLQQQQQQQQARQPAQVWNAANMTTAQQYVTGYQGFVAHVAPTAPSNRGGMNTGAAPPVVTHHPPPPQVNTSTSQAQSFSVESRSSAILPSRDPGTQGQHTSYSAAETRAKLAQTETNPMPKQPGHHPHQYEGRSQTSLGSHISHPQAQPGAASTQPQLTPANPSQSVSAQRASHPTVFPKNQRAQVPQANTQTRLSQPQSVKPIDQPRASPPSAATQSTAHTTSQSASTKDVFIHQFQQAVQYGPEYVKLFWSSAMKGGVPNEWFIAAVNTIPGHVWQHIQFTLLQSNAPKTTVNATTSAQSAVSSAAYLTSRQAMQSTQNPSQTVHLSPAAEVTTYPVVAAQPKSRADEQTATPAAQIGKTAIPMPVPVLPLTPEQSKTRESFLPRTPQQADKSRLARDILRSLGRNVPTLLKGKDKADEPQLDGTKHQQQRREEVQENVKQIISDKEIAAQNLPINPSTASPAVAVVAPSNIPITKSSRSVAPVPVIPEPAPSSSPAKPALPPEVATVATQLSLSKPPTRSEVPNGQPGPITIDLTLADSTASAGASSPKTAIVSKLSPRPASPVIALDPPPQPESLTLDETCVQKGTEDVHMTSPLLSPSGDVGPTPPPATFAEPAAAEAASGTFPDASENFPSAKLPLFLPSPPNSSHVSNHSSALGPPETDDEAMSVESESKPSLKRRSVDVENLVGGTAESPPLRVKKKRKQVYVLVPSPTPSLRKLIEKTKKKGRARSVDVTSDSASDGEETDLRYNHFERVVIEEAKSQLMEKRCRWSDCDAILNCGYNLHAHLKQHSQEQSARHCNWKGCRKRFHAQDQRDLHLERHAVLSLPCPFAGCDEVFDRPIEVMHHEMEHRDDGRPLVQKPTYKPFVPSIPAKLGRPPERLPSYRVLPRRIIKSSISADRHAVVGPWVLWHIFSPVNLNMRKQNATMRGRPARQVDDGDSTGGIDTRQDEYDFLLAQSPTASRLPPLDDLESQLVTQFASRGLILWAPDPPKDDLKPSSCITASTNDGSIASVADTAPEALDTSTVPKEFVDRTEAPQVESTEIAASSSSAEPVTEELPARVSLGNGEEEIVERMLVM